MQFPVVQATRGVIFSNAHRRTPKRGHRHISRPHGVTAHFEANLDLLKYFGEASGAAYRASLFHLSRAQGNSVGIGERVWFHSGPVF